MRELPCLVLAFSLSLALAEAATGQEPADLILVDGVIHTMDPNAPEVDALAASDGKIVAIGETSELLANYRGTGTVVIDAGGGAVLPGLIDAHGHVLGLGRALRTLDLVGSESSAEIADAVREAAATRSPGEWIIGGGWDQNDWAVKEFPSRDELDRAAPANPVLLDRVDGHAIWVNTIALEAGGVAAATPDPEGGQIVRDSAGRPTGILIDRATDLVERAIPLAGEAELEATLTVAQDRLVSLGLTGVHDVGVGPDTLAFYRRWDEEGRLIPRIVAYLSAPGPAAVDWWRDEGAALYETPGRRFRVRGTKSYADGALGSRGAALLAPYRDALESTGLLRTRPDSLSAIVAGAMELGLQPVIHAIGDRGNRVALEAIAAGERELAAANPPRPCATAGGGNEDCGDVSSGLRPRIEHVQVVALDDIPRFAELGVIASFQPTHATSDMYWAEDRVGPERLRGAYAWRKFRESGVRIVCGSDFPVESPNPFFGIYAAVTRQDQEGWPAGGWRPEERMTREEALACFTRDAAWAAGMEDEVGTLSVGKRADFVIVDRDPFTAPAEELWKTRVLRTVIDGETVYEP